VEAVLTAAPFTAWAENLHALAHVTLSIVVLADLDPNLPPEQRPHQGRTGLSTIDGVQLQAGQDAEWWRQQLIGHDVTFQITLVPRQEDGPGEIKAFLMHELLLHARSMLDSLQSLRAHGANLPAHGPDRQRLWAHVETILEGEDRQHGEFQAWVAYLNLARQLGDADKLTGEGDKMETGSDLILSAVEDVIAHVSTPGRAPLLTPESRGILREAAERIGHEELAYRQAHPEQFPVSPPSSPVQTVQQ
jgi:hypothetical protein